uniref:Dilute domain-containing protein n=1 Tax=Caenorhabditis japonica TaxID=281687 RepID=A0A8R1E0T1_CAEJA
MYVIALGTTNRNGQWLIVGRTDGLVRFATLLRCQQFSPFAVFYLLHDRKNTVHTTPTNNSQLLMLLLSFSLPPPSIYDFPFSWRNSFYFILFHLIVLGKESQNTSDEEIIRLEAFQKDSVTHNAFLDVYNVPEFARIIVCELKPPLARLLTKNLPAYLLLAAFRHQDEKHDETALTGLFSSVHLVLKDTISRSHDLDLLALWLINLWRLFNLLRQYSGEDNAEWHVANTETQNSYRFKAYDVAPIRDQLKLRIEECYNSLMKKAIEHVFCPKIVPGILQHESSSDLMTAGQESRGRADSQRKSLNDLLAFLDTVHSKLKTYGGDEILVKQVIGQMANWMCALALNHMMFRRELCNFEKAIQIKHNVTEIQNWLNSKGLPDCREHLEPLVQACHLLQSRKDASNLDTLCGEMTSRLKPRQVVAILQHYDPSDEMEDGLSADFLIEIQKKLNQRAIANGDPLEDKNALIMMGTYLPPFNTQPFSYSDFPLETLSLPSCLHMQSVCRLL